MNRYLPIIAICLLVSIVYLAGGLEFLDQRLLDARFQAATRQVVSDVVVVPIDSESLHELKQWPLSRDKHAQVLDNLLAAGAKRVAFALDLSTPTTEENDARFSQSIANAKGRVILGVFQRDAPAEHASPGLKVDQPLTALGEHARLGTISIQPGDDGLVRTYDLGDPDAESYFPSLAALLAGTEVRDPGDFQIDYGVDVTSIPQLSYMDVLHDNFETSTFRDKVVIVGVTASPLGDRYLTPVHITLPGSLIQALAYESLVSGRTMHRSGAPLIILGVLLIGLWLGPIFESFTGPRGGLLVAVVSLTLFLTSLAIQHFGTLMLDCSTWIITLISCYCYGTVRRVSKRTAQARLKGNELTQSASLMRHVVDNSFDSVLVLDEQGTIVTFSGTAERLFGYQEPDAQGLNIAGLVMLGRESGHYKADLIDLVDSEAPIEVECRRMDRSKFHAEMTISSYNTEGECHRVVFLRDITQRKAQQQLLRHQAAHDPLTGLPNRYALQKKLARAIIVAQEEEWPIALLLLNLDRFREINDTLGHHLGDLLLQQLSERLQVPLRGTDTLAHIGGDEFGILLVDTDQRTAQHMSQELIQVLDQPFHVGGFDLQVDTAVGISMYPEHGNVAEELMQRSDMAMYAAKSTRMGMAVYDVAQNSASVRQLTLTGDLRRAITAGELTLHYQPKIEARSQEVVGVEALIRWGHPKLGNIRPDEIIDLAEKTGLIRPLTRWVLRTALAQEARWIEQGFHFGIAVNISVRNLLEEELPGTLEGILEVSGVDASYLTLEVTEGAIMEDPERALDIVSELAKLGVGISVDDFGTGYSSLGYVKQLPANEIKIDRSFVMEMGHSLPDETIVRSTIDLVHSLGRKVVAEGVETKAIWEKLLEFGVDYGQGYLFSRPRTADSFIDWIESKYGNPADQAKDKKDFARTLA
jgi:diguanylate cyclase (GGDEF)-like protein/PAS domain S-box-containing protein